LCKKNYWTEKQLQNGKAFVRREEGHCREIILTLKDEKAGKKYYY